MWCCIKCNVIVVLYLTIAVRNKNKQSGALQATFPSFTAERTEASSSSEKQPAAKKRQRDPSPVFDSSNQAKEAVSQAEPVTSGKPNNTSSRREELLRELKAVEDAIAKKRARIE